MQQIAYCIDESLNTLCVPHCLTWRFLHKYCNILLSRKLMTKQILCLFMFHIKRQMSETQFKQESPEGPETLPWGRGWQFLYSKGLLSVDDTVLCSKMNTLGIGVGHYGTVFISNFLTFFGQTMFCILVPMPA